MRIPAYLLIPVVVLSAPLMAQDAQVWSGAELKQYSKKLKPNLNADHYATENLGNYGSHYMLMVYREGNGPAELHAKQTDFYVVQEGSATLHLGGKITESKEIEPGEVRGKSIEGGKTRKLKPGDVVDIPANTPHQITLGKGETITYLIVKIHAKE
ncbi:MAG: cupin domain-containing protein [Bryobacterales bacterium]